MSDVYTQSMTKRLVEIDDDVLEVARAALGTATITATVNEALRRVGTDHAAAVERACDVLASADLDDRSASWR